MGVIQQKLDLRTLEELQTAILKNAVNSQIRLEWSDVMYKLFIFSI